MDSAITTEVVDAVAAVEDVDPADLDAPLQHVVSTDALATLAAHDSESWTVSFFYAGHDVVVRGDGAVLVDGTRGGTWTRARASAEPDLPASGT